MFHLDPELVDAIRGALLVAFLACGACAAAYLLGAMALGIAI